MAKILNVDDHDAGRYARSRFLSRAGFEVCEASNGADALTLVRSEHPDLVLLDINLPDISGFEVCKQVKTDPDTERIPVILLSAARLADLDVVRGLESGGDNYLREPIDPAVLVATVRALLRAREAEEELARSNEQLRRFAFSVSHELQEPLRMIKSYTQLLARKYVDATDSEAKEYTDYVVGGVQRMEKFISDMLSYSQSVEGQLDLKPVSARVAIDIALMELSALLNDSEATITIGEMPQVQADSMRLSQVFRNLIGNAIKYRSEAPPRIDVTATEQRSDWVFAVRDNGMGFEPKYADQIFGLFKRLHGREKAGSGVGLAITKEIVERHGGRIWVESAPGHGSTFYFTLLKGDG